MTGADFESLRQRLARAGWLLRRTDGADGPVTFYAERGWRVRHLPDLAAVAALADALGAGQAAAPGARPGAGHVVPPPGAARPPARRRRRRAVWHALLPGWAMPRPGVDWRAPGYAGPAALAALRLRLRAGIVERVRAEMPADLLRWLDLAGADVWCESVELDAYAWSTGAAWRAWVEFPWGRPADEFLTACRAMRPRPRVRFDGAAIDRRRLLACFAIHGPAVAPHPWRELLQGGDA